MSCLFDALGYFAGESGALMRQRLCNYMTRDAPIQGSTIHQRIRWESGQTPEDYITHMRRPATWGGALEVACFVELYGWRVVCGYAGPAGAPDTTYEPVCHAPHETVRIIWYAGGHYEPDRTWPRPSVVRAPVIERLACPRLQRARETWQTRGREASATWAGTKVWWSSDV